MKQHSQNKEASSKKHSKRKNAKSIEFWIVLVFYIIQVIIAILTYYQDKRGYRK
jgi:amino acid permease